MLKKIKLLQDGDDDDFLIAVADVTETIFHPGVEVYPVMWVRYGDDVFEYCSKAWVDEQKVIDEIDYDGDMDFSSIYENIILKRKNCD